MTPARARSRRRLAGLAASLGVHVAVLLAFMSVEPRLTALPRLPAPPEAVVELELQRPEARAVAATAPRRAATSARARLATTPSTTSRLPEAAAPSPAPAPSVVAPSATSPAPQASAADEGRWRVRAGAGGDAAGAARALVRGAVGCGSAEWLHLSREERDRCNADFVVGMRTLKLDAIPAAKRAYYDKVVAAYGKMRAPTPLSHANVGDNFGLQERWEGPPGAHPPAVGCKIGLAKPRGWKTYANRAGPPHSLRLGPLPCFVTPPSGFGTEEADVPPPASLREQEDDAAHAARYAPPGR